MRRYSGIICLFLLFFSLAGPDAAAARRHGGSAYNPLYADIIVDGNTGTVLHQTNSDQLRYPASLTKMMTLYLAFESLQAGNLDMNEMLYVSPHAASQARVTLDLQAGERISTRDAILSVIVRSANDSAVVLGEALGGSELQFALMMTKKARQLGMSRTTFQNASGLNNDFQRTTARDLAKMVIALQRDFPQYYPLFSRTSFTYRGRIYLGHNKVTKIYRGADGVKTGFIGPSGYNLASSAVRGGHRLIGVVLGGRTAAWRDRRMMQLLDNAFASYNPPGQKPASNILKHKRKASRRG